MNILSIILRNKILIASISMVLSITIPTTATAIPTKGKDPHSIRIHKINPNKPASKFEVITAVKKNFSGRILSVRKRYKAYGNDCHHVKFIDKKGELFLIRVGCKKK